MEPVPLAEMEAGLTAVLQSPLDDGVLALIVRRPKTALREVLEEGRLDPAEGLVGDDWKTPARSGPTPDVEVQLTLMNSRAIAVIAREQELWPLAGDQLFVDFDLSTENIPPGTRLSVGEAIIAVTAVPHTGCSKFRSRFGSDAVKFVNSKVGRQLNLRGINAKILQPGTIRVGDRIKKLP